MSESPAAERRQNNSNKQNKAIYAKQHRFHKHVSPSASEDDNQGENQAAQVPASRSAVHASRPTSASHKRRRRRNRSLTSSADSGGSGANKEGRSDRSRRRTTKTSSYDAKEQRLLSGPPSRVLQELLSWAQRGKHRKLERLLSACGPTAAPALASAVVAATSASDNRAHAGANGLAGLPSAPGWSLMHHVSAQPG
jgi:Flp pilus assembly protein TadB